MAINRKFFLDHLIILQTCLHLVHTSWAKKLSQLRRPLCPSPLAFFLQLVRHIDNVSDACCLDVLQRTRESTLFISYLIASTTSFILFIRANGLQKKPCDREVVVSLFLLLRHFFSHHPEHFTHQVAIQTCPFGQIIQEGQYGKDISQKMLFVVNEISWAFAIANSRPDPSSSQFHGPDDSVLTLQAFQQGVQVQCVFFHR